MPIFSLYISHFQRVCESSFIRLTYGLSIADFAVEIRDSYPNDPAISSDSPENGMRILPISIRREYNTRPHSSRWRIFIRLRAALTKTNTSPSRRFMPIRFVTMPLKPLNPMRMFTGRL